ncbi:MAG: hypothetical protein ABEI75_02130 [Halobaculum sp.]
MADEGIIAADATKNTFHDQHPNGVSVISVAIAVEDHGAFNQRYLDIVADKIDHYGIQLPHPILKSKDISRYVPTWQVEQARRDIVLDLLSIDVLDTIFVTETYLQPSWIELYEEEENAFRREISHEFVDDILFQYYDIASLWKYLERYDSGYQNVMTDHFSGQVNRAYERLGQISDQFAIVPQGDRTYPVLAMADLVTGLLKQEVYPLRKDEIREYIKDETPGYVAVETIHEDDDLNKLVPHVTDQIRTDLNAPKPTVYIDRSNVSLDKDDVRSLDLFHHACFYALQHDGCVTFFEKNNDRYHFTDDDILVCLDDDVTRYSDFANKNTSSAVTLLTSDEALEQFLNGIPDEYVL